MPSNTMAHRICDTNQGSLFTSEDCTDVPTRHAIRIGMDVKGSWIDNIFVERLWRSVKYEKVYLNAHDSVAATWALLVPILRVQQR